MEEAGLALFDADFHAESARATALAARSAPRVRSAPLKARNYHATMSTTAPHVGVGLPPPRPALIPSSSSSVSPPTTCPDSPNLPASSLTVLKIENTKKDSSVHTVRFNSVPPNEGGERAGGAPEKATRPSLAFAVQRNATRFSRRSLPPSVKAARAPAEPPTLRQRGL